MSLLVPVWQIGIAMIRIHGKLVGLDLFAEGHIEVLSWRICMQWRNKFLDFFCPFWYHIHGAHLFTNRKFLSKNRIVECFKGSSFGMGHRVIISGTGALFTFKFYSDVQISTAIINTFPLINANLFLNFSGITVASLLQGALGVNSGSPMSICQTCLVNTR